MTFIARNSRVFYAKIPDDGDFLYKNGGRMRIFEDNMDLRSWHTSCFERHNYLIELISQRTKDEDEEGNTGSKEKDGTESGNDNKEPVGDQINPRLLELENVPAARKKKREVDQSEFSSTNLVDKKRTSREEVERLSEDDKQQSLHDGEKKLTVRVASYERDHLLVQIHNVNALANFWKMKYIHVLRNNASLKKDLKTMQDTKNNHIAKIQSDLNRYLEICQVQKEKMMRLRQELKTMELTVVELQKDKCCRNFYRQKTPNY